MNAIAKALYTAAMNQDKETTEIIERRFGKGESRIKICRELYIEEIFGISTATMANIFSQR